MNFKLTVLGNNSAIPCYGRHPSAQVLTVHDQLMLIDCGEGTQLQLESFGIKKMKIGHIFISHLHGDHVFGLPGLLTTFSLLRREKPLYIYGPIGIEDMIMGFLDHARAVFNYELNFIEVNTTQKELILDHPHVKIYAFPLDHGIPIHGYLFEENLTKLKIRTDAIEKYNIPEKERSRIAMGEDYTLPSGEQIKNIKLTYPKRKPLSYAYCTDTTPQSRLINWVKGVSLLYHETTYLHEMKQQALERYHSTTRQAATIAKKAYVKNLIIGHFSSRYQNLQPLLEECQEIFPETILSIEGSTIDLNEIGR